MLKLPAFVHLKLSPVRVLRSWIEPAGTGVDGLRLLSIRAATEPVPWMGSYVTTFRWLKTVTKTIAAAMAGTSQPRETSRRSVSTRSVSKIAPLTFGDGRRSSQESKRVSKSVFMFHSFHRMPQLL